MGTDIELHVEVKILGKWEHYSEPCVWRNYTLFSLMADVRNDGNVEPIARPRGLPADASAITRLCYDGDDSRTTSWLSSEEVRRVFEWMTEKFSTGALGTLERFGGLPLLCDMDSFWKWPQDNPVWLEDFRWVFWFDQRSPGVPWLHVRLDDRPKYYSHAPYRTPVQPGMLKVQGLSFLKWRFKKLTTRNPDTPEFRLRIRGSSALPPGCFQMPLTLELYASQRQRWPSEGRCILAQYDADTIVVYQAYAPDIGEFAIANGKFGGRFSFSRMSWIKPNFLWMMYRSGWGTKEGQECTLGLRVRRAFFDRLLAGAVPSGFSPERYSSDAEWKAAISGSEVRLQWDPDHDPAGLPLPRRAIQLGLRGKTLAEFASEELLEVIDLRSFVDEQRPRALSGDFAALMTPRESVYSPSLPGAAQNVGIDPLPS